MYSDNKYLITIAIVSHKQIHLVKRLLSSLQEHHPKQDFQVYVLENIKNQPPLSSTDYNIPIYYFKNKSPTSFSANVNKIFRYMERKTEYFCVLNPDVEFQEEIFPELLNTMRKSNLDIASPIVVNHDGQIQDTFRSIPTPKQLFFRVTNLEKNVNNFVDLPIISYPDWIAGMFMFMSTYIFEQVGGFNTRYFISKTWIFASAQKNWGIKSVFIKIYK